MLDLMLNYVQLLILAPLTAVTADVLVGLHHWHNPVMLKKKITDKKYNKNPTERT